MDDKKKEQCFEYLDKMRLKGDNASNYTKRELIAHNFGIGTQDATKIVEEYNRDIPNRKQLLAE